MATKTLILRPTSVTADDESKVALYPTDTTMANAHMLVNEEVADDDATYTSITGAGGALYYHFMYNKPDDMVTITSASIKTKEKLESGTNSGAAQIYINDLHWGVYSEGSWGTAYENYTFSVSGMIENINAAVSGDTFSFYRSTNAQSSKFAPLRCTQVYIEITYEDSIPDVLSVKKDGAWTTVDYASVYYKTGGAWTLSDTSILQNNNQYIVKEV